MTIPLHLLNKAVEEVRREQNPNWWQRCEEAGRRHRIDPKAIEDRFFLMYPERVPFTEHARREKPDRKRAKK